MSFNDVCMHLNRLKMLLFNNSSSVLCEYINEHFLTIISILSEYIIEHFLTIISILCEYIIEHFLTIMFHVSFICSFTIFQGIHGYSVNDRLYTEGMNVDEEGNTICPVCLIPRKEPNKEQPGFVRYFAFKNVRRQCIIVRHMITILKNI